MEASQRIGFRARTPHSVLKLVKTGQLVAHRINARTIRISQAEVDRFLADCATNATARSSRARQ